MAAFDYNEFDREIWDVELEDFVPSTVYDMHVHLWSEAHKGSAPDPPIPLRLEVDFQGQLDWAANLCPGREVHFAVLGTPVPGLDAGGHNDWIAEQTRSDPRSAVHMLVMPDMQPEYVAEQAKRGDFIGLKPYRFFAPDPASARIREFLPEAHIEVADDLGLSIVLHLSKRTGPADHENLQDLEQYTTRYPRVQWVLPHCARAFSGYFLEESIRRLRDLPNLWYDTSGVNDLYAHYLLMKHEDPSRVMYGSDSVAAGCVRGVYVTYGRAWEFFPGFPELPHCDPRATLVVYEQLRQTRRVAEMLGLTRREIEDHFSGNGIRFIETARALRKA